MALFGLLTRPDINVGVAEARQTPGALLLDVRTKAEYDAGHIAAAGVSRWTRCSKRRRSCPTKVRPCSFIA